MSPEAHGIAYPLLAAMNGRVRAAVVRRIEAMERELEFLAQKEDVRLLAIRTHGWSDDRLRVIFALNSVYQQVLGPLQAVARGGPQGLGGEVPIRHGSFAFSASTTVRIQQSMRAFEAVASELRIPQSWLHANTCGDVVYAIQAANEWR